MMALVIGIDAPVKAAAYRPNTRIGTHRGESTPISNTGASVTAKATSRTVPVKGMPLRCSTLRVTRAPTIAPTWAGAMASAVCRVSRPNTYW